VLVIRSVLTVDVVALDISSVHDSTSFNCLAYNILDCKISDFSCFEDLGGIFLDNNPRPQFKFRAFLFFVVPLCHVYLIFQEYSIFFEWVNPLQ
jgi:hypothetical protein